MVMGHEARNLGKHRGKTLWDARSVICNKLKSKGSPPGNNVMKCKLCQPVHGSRSMGRYK